MNPNRALWDRVSKTDPKHVKPITGKQYSGNSPKPYYIVERLTEEFGPCGKGWGFVVLSERMERMSDHDVLHIALVRFWYVLEGSRHEFDQMGQTKAAYMTSKGSLLVDEDAPKKSVTDALVKCASYLGFAGDIFSGRWDDSKYVAELRKEFSEDKERRPDIPTPNHPGVAAMVTESESADLKPEVIGYLSELASEIRDSFKPANGAASLSKDEFERVAKIASDRIELEKLDIGETMYLTMQLPTPMQRAIKAASVAKHRVGMPA